MAKKITATHIEFDKDGNIKSKSVTETVYDRYGNMVSSKSTLDDAPELEDKHTTYDDDEYDDYDDDNVRYKITPKGLAWLAMMRAGILNDWNVEGKMFEEFWADFEAGMTEAGYVTEEKEEKENDK